MGYYNVYMKRRDCAAAIDILQTALDFFDRMRNRDASSFLDKTNVCLYVGLAMAQTELGETDAARASLHRARAMAEAFDRQPDYEADSIRFVSFSERKTAFDDLGATAMECIRNALLDEGSDALLALWEEIRHAE